MKSICLSLTLSIGPFLGIVYFYFVKLLMSFSEAARYLERGGSIRTDQLTTYKSVLVIAALFGYFCAFMLAREISKFMQKKNEEYNS